MSPSFSISQECFYGHNLWWCLWWRQRALECVPYFLLEEDLERERGDSLNSAQINYLQYFFNRKKSSLQEKEKKRDTEISNFRKMAPLGLL